MVSGEADGTQRITAIVQYTASELQALVHGTTDMESLVEEGTEDSATSWAHTYTNFGTPTITIADDATYKETGSNSLKITVPNLSSGTVWHLEYTISSAFDWSAFISLSFQHDRAYTDSYHRIYLELVDSAGNTATFRLPSTPKDEWVLNSVPKGVFTLSGISEASSIVTLRIKVHYILGVPAWDLHIDSMNFSIIAGSPVILRVDASGHIQANILNVADAVIDPATESGVLADILTAFDSPSTADHGDNDSIGTSATQLNASSTPMLSALIQAKHDNTDLIYVGFSGITAGEGTALDAGDAVLITIDNLNKLYAISASGTQKVSWLYVTT